MTFGPYGGFHGHLDKLSFVFFGHGTELGVDPGRAKSQAYRLPIHTEWYKSTIGHNALIIDGTSQEPAEGRLLNFVATDDWAAAAALCDRGYPGVRHTRLLMLSPTYLLVLDTVEANRDIRADWVYHNRGSGITCRAARAHDAPSPSLDGISYVENAAAGASSDTVRATFALDGIINTLTMAPAPATKVVTGDGVGESIFDRVPLIIASRVGRRVSFATVLEPTANGGDPSVQDVGIEESSGATIATVRRRDGSDRVTFGPEASVVAETDSAVALQDM
jgi:hypothetical protein